MADLTFADIALNVETQAESLDFGSAFFKKIMNGASDEMSVDGSVTPVVFEFGPDDYNDGTKDAEIREFKVQLRDNQYTVDGFMGINTPLTNGVLIEIKSNNSTLSYEPIVDNGDWEFKFTVGAGSEVDLTIDNSGNILTATSRGSIVLARKDYHGVGNDDYIRITIRDDISNLVSMKAILLTNEREILA